ncbi:hypothetical protein AC579_6815 [Pseudocercospora musae]|uniref:Heterokaryon incompatibility domain-containing protein n=1 Tax=Pseudocercospora musae TaxID=113226 RepID=A0A139IQL5_9PEZI|nr:hypothetical protein AC579_6815 [Pseudocercospora musae]
MGASEVLDLYHSCARLEHSKDIRLIALHTSAVDEVRIDLETTSLDRSASYRAVSYAWGKQYEDGAHLTHVLKCAGVDIPVTAHLYAGLKRIREMEAANLQVQDRPLPPRIVLWVDAICINQADLEERSQQVRIMDQIYSKAESTIVWVGIRAEAPSYETSMLYQISNRQWFRRRWTLQEYILSEHVIFLVGSNWVSAPRLAKAADSIRHSSLPHFVMQRDKGRGLTLMENMISLTRHRCTEPSDYVCALLGVSTDGYKFKVDYTSHYSHLFIDVTGDYLCSLPNPANARHDDQQQVCKPADTLSRLATILELVVLSRKDQVAERDALPSRVPDWSSLKETPELKDLLQFRILLIKTQSEVVRAYDVDIGTTYVNWQGSQLVVEGITVTPQDIKILQVIAKNRGCGILTEGGVQKAPLPFVTMALVMIWDVMSIDSEAMQQNRTGYLLIPGVDIAWITRQRLEASQEHDGQNPTTETGDSDSSLSAFTLERPQDRRWNWYPVYEILEHEFGYRSKAIGGMIRRECTRICLV